MSVDILEPTVVLRSVAQSSGHILWLPSGSLLPVLSAWLAAIEPLEAKGQKKLVWPALFGLLGETYINA
jgi:hypothetical protein